MVDKDISTADALRLLSQPLDAPAASPGHGRDDDRWALSRRRFLQGIGAGLGGAMVGGLSLPGTFGWDHHMAEAAPVGPTEGILVVLGMFGGNDGLRMVAPIGNRHYRRVRQSVYVTPADALALSGDYGLAPELTGLKARWDAGQVAIVQGAGYPGADLSHFTSMAYWMSGRPHGVPSSGWVGRWLDGQATDDLFRAVTVGSSIPLHMQGTARRAIGVPPWGLSFGTQTGAEHQRAYAAFSALADQPASAGAWAATLGANVRNTITVAQSVSPVFDDAQGQLPDDELARKMVVAARLINADLGFRVLDMGYGDFDHHSQETDAHPQRMRELDAALDAFFAALAPQWRNRVTIMTFSEFGRTPFDNDSAGTDHGTSHPMLVIGDGVRGGLYGTHPDLASIVHDWDRMEHTVDFRSVYASVLDGWLGGGSSDVLGGTFEDLRLFRSGPGGAPPVAPQLRVQGDVVAMPPARIFDSAAGLGLPRLERPLQPDEIISVQVAGRGGVPAMAQRSAADVPLAVLLHVTPTGATQPTDLTVWASDDPRPALVSTSVPTGGSTPAVVVTRLGADGKVNIRNRAGRCHVRVEVAGWFRGRSAARLTTVSPRLLVDTAAGIGAPVQKVRSLDVVVTGGSVPSGATSVVLNVTASSASADSALTVWAAGTTKPASPVGPVLSGASARRLVVASVGSGGKVSLDVGAARAHLRVEVLGWFGPSGATRQIANEPVAVLDTRWGIGRSAGRLGTSAVPVRVTGVGDVPATRVGAVLLEVTTSAASTGGRLTVWRGGTTRPDIAQVTSRTDRPVSNLVLVRPGSDGTVRVAHSAGLVHVRMDVVAWYTPV